MSALESEESASSPDSVSSSSLPSDLSFCECDRDP